MKQIYFIIILLTTLTIGILSINLVGVTFAQDKMKHLQKLRILF